ncbi:hydrogenase formation protein HypD [Patescibacteria group bacterium]|nr:MAG: hydrogenase formation protein HypD [Patescibacteria group bacterium]
MKASSPKKSKIIGEIEKKAALLGLSRLGEAGRSLRFMELCGTHSQAVARYGIKGLLPKNVKLLSGPGCPVCVTDQEDVDILVGLALSGVPIAAYGDAINVPGNKLSLDQARQQGAQVFTVYDVMQALALKKKYPKLVFWGLGFETTTPMTAWAIKNGLTVFSSHKIFPPAMAALLKNKEIKIDGFIDPGHVSAIIGTEVYKKFKVPQVIAGFGAEDVLNAIDKLLDQLIRKEYLVENEYGRVVRRQGNRKAQKIIVEVFEIGDAKWRGLGMIKKSGLKIKKKYRSQDASWVYRQAIKKIRQTIKHRPTGCRCGLVLQGVIESTECPLFAKVCTPENPKGACMVSVEGSCNVEYRYGKNKR